MSGALFAISALIAGAFVLSSAAAQTGEPIKIGYSMSVTGGLGANGRSALLAQKIWGGYQCQRRAARPPCEACLL